MINILFIGDIIGASGLGITLEILPKIQKDYGVDFVIANGENIRHGKGLTIDIAIQLRDAGVDIITSGNHIWEGQDKNKVLETLPFVLRPHNYPISNPGTGWRTCFSKHQVQVTVINIQGRSFMTPINCPFLTIDEILTNNHKQLQICIVDFHAESTAEKQALGWYLDGKVSAVVGTHTHVQTADERIFPRGTGYITDVGMTGPFNSVIGMEKNIAIKRFIQQTPYYYKPGEGDPRFNGVLIEVNEKDYNTNKIKRFNFSVLEYNGRKTN